MDSKLILSDKRFGRMFSEKDYQIDFNSREYLLTHPSGPRTSEISVEEELSVAESNRVDIRPKELNLESNLFDNWEEERKIFGDVIGDMARGEKEIFRGSGRKKTIRKIGREEGRSSGGKLGTKRRVVIPIHKLNKL